MLGTISTGKSGGIKYLQSGEDKNRLLSSGEIITRDMLDERVTLQGDLRATEKILEHVKENKSYTQDYYHLTFSFKEDITADEMKEISSEVESFYLSGYNQEEYNIYSEAHVPQENAQYKLLTAQDGDKKYYELLSEKEAEQFKEQNPDKAHLLEKRFTHFHIIIPRENILTNTQLKLTEKDESKEFNSFQEYINIKYGLESPKENIRDLSNKQYKNEKFKNVELQSTDFKDLTNAQTKQLLTQDIESQIQEGDINSFEDMKNYLSEQDYIITVDEIKTAKNEYLKIKIQGQEKNINLRGDIFRKDFYIDKEINFNSEVRRIEGKSLSDYKADMKSYTERRTQEVAKRYDYAREKSLKHDLIEKALKDKFENRTLENTDDKKIIKDLEDNKSIFLTGGAGVGKSYTTNKVIEHYEEQGQNVAKLGSTGIAANNVNGQTLHSYFDIGIKKDIKELKEYDQENKDRLQSLKSKLRNTDLIVIDEISMVSDKQMDMIKYRLEQAEYKGKVMLVGDFNQLPPVAKNEKVGYAFESKAWKDLNTKTHELTEIKRSDNKEFTELLNRLRYGHLEDKDNQFIKDMQSNKIDEKKATYIYSTNKAVTEHNKQKLDELQGEKETYKTDLKSDQVLTKKEQDLLLEETPLYKDLELKENAPVLITMNDKELNVANGDKGIYQGMNENNEMLIKLDRNDEIIAIAKKEFKAELETDDRKISMSATNYPVRPAFAITTHKSQGMSIENLAIDPNKQFEKNQFYVALSRAKNPNSTKILKLDDKHKEDFRTIIKQDNKVLDFYHPTLRTKELKEFDKKVQDRQNLKREEYFKKQKEKKDEIKSKVKEDSKSTVLTPLKTKRESNYHQFKKDRLEKKEIVNRLKEKQSVYQKLIGDKKMQGEQLKSKIQERQRMSKKEQEEKLLDEKKQNEKVQSSKQQYKQPLAEQKEVSKNSKEKVQDKEVLQEAENEGFEKLRHRDTKHKDFEAHKANQKAPKKESDSLNALKERQAELKEHSQESQKKEREQKKQGNILEK